MATPEELAAQEAETKAQAAAAKEKELSDQAKAAEKKTDAEEETNTDDEKFDKDRAMDLIKKLRGENKELGKKAKKADEFELAETKRKEAEMTELQKAQAKVAELEAKVKADARRELQRVIAAKHKLPAELADLLPGETEEEMEAKAAALAKAIPAVPNLSPNNPPGNAQETEAQKRERLLGRKTDFWVGGGVIEKTKE